MYYDYPPPTYLEYPILIAQGELSLFQTQTYFMAHQIQDWLCEELFKEKKKACIHFQSQKDI